MSTDVEKPAAGWFSKLGSLLTARSPDSGPDFASPVSARDEHRQTLIIPDPNHISSATPPASFALSAPPARRRADAPQSVESASAFTTAAVPQPDPKLPIHYHFVSSGQIAPMPEDPFRSPVMSHYNPYSRGLPPPGLLASRTLTAQNPFDDSRAATRRVSTMSGPLPPTPGTGRYPRAI